MATVCPLCVQGIGWPISRKQRHCMQSEQPGDGGSLVSHPRTPTSATAGSPQTQTAHLAPTCSSLVCAFHIHTQPLATLRANLLGHSVPCTWAFPRTCQSLSGLAGGRLHGRCLERRGQRLEQKQKNRDSEPFLPGNSIADSQHQIQH